MTDEPPSNEPLDDEPLSNEPLDDGPLSAAEPIDAPMFPLGSVLFPHMPIALRVFEQRYLAMLAVILQEEPSEFGIVLIERGQEVGGGEHRFSVGTIAEITELDGAEDFVALVAQGTTRFEITQWLEDDPYPRAMIRPLPELDWDEELRTLRQRAEEVVRRVLALASEFADQQWSATVELSDDEVAACWQLAAIAPLGQFDQVALLKCATLRELLDAVIENTLAAEQMMLASWLEQAPNDYPEDEYGGELDGDESDEPNRP